MIKYASIHSKQCASENGSKNTQKSKLYPVMYVFALMQPKSAQTISTNNHYLCVGIGFCANWLSSMHVCIGGFLVA